ncbi:MAG: FGGY-family carbohydrate kinase [Gammaproteobacteria bacterium]|jgi:sugar (pentulose or hexulose) kinase
MEMQSSSSLYLGLDLGTSGCRGIVINDQETIVVQARVSFEAKQDKASFHQQNAYTWWQAVREVCKQLAQQIDLTNIISLSVDGTSGTVLLCNKKGEPLHEALMYNDARATGEAERLQQLGIDNSAVLSPTSGLAKLLWLKQQAFSNDAAYFLHQADWVNGKLLNQFGDTDINNALKSGYDTINKEWPGWFKQLDINMDWLPRVHQPGDILGAVDHNAAQLLGLSSQVKIVAGTTDSTAAIVATGANKVGEAITSLGSTLVTKIITEQPLSDSSYGIYSQPYGKYWLVGGASNSGGAVLKQFFTTEQLNQLTPQLKPEQSTNLNYYPLPSTGERFPVNDPARRPVLSPRPESDVEFFQAILEGIARIERQAYQRLHELGTPYPTHVLTCGGGASNQPWCKIRERFLNVPVKSSQQQEAAFGMALIAKRATE